MRDEMLGREVHVRDYGGDEGVVAVDLVVTGELGDRDRVLRVVDEAVARLLRELPGDFAPTAPATTKP